MKKKWITLFIILCLLMGYRVQAQSSVAPPAAGASPQQLAEGYKALYQQAAANPTDTAQLYAYKTAINTQLAKLQAEHSKAQKFGDIGRAKRLAADIALLQAALNTGVAVAPSPTVPAKSKPIKAPPPPKNVAVAIAAEPAIKTPKPASNKKIMLQVGIHLPHYKLAPSAYITSYKPVFVPKIKVGLSYTMPLSSQINVMPQLSYLQTGGKYSTVSLAAHAWQLGLGLQYLPSFLSKGKVQPYLLLTPYYTGIMGGTFKNESAIISEPLTQDHLSAKDIGVQLGLGCVLNSRLHIGIQYQLGISNTYGVAAELYAPSAKRYARSIGVGVGYSIF